MGMRDFIENHIKLRGNPIHFSQPWSLLIDHIANNLHNPDAKPIVIKKGRQVMASTLIRVLNIAIALSEDKSKMIHLYPTLNLAHFGGRELDNLILDASRGTSRKRNGTLKSIIEERIPWASMSNTRLFKAFDNNSFIMLETVGRDACRLRGVSADFMTFDEAQDMSHSAIDIARTTLGTSKFGPKGRGFRIYVFTPKGSSSSGAMYNMWNSSSQNEWNYICPKCNRKFELTVNNWENILRENTIIKCPECSTFIDKKDIDGKWMAEFPKHEYDGFHLFYPMVNTVTKEEIKSLRKTMSLQLWANEVWGEFYD